MLWLRGELDVATASFVRDALDDACRDTSVEVIVDLSDVQFFDTSTVGIFDRADIQLGLTGRRLTLLGLTPHQEKLLRICKMEHLLAVAVSRRASWPDASARPGI